MSDLSVSNRTTHQYTYTLAAGEQDGTTALIIAFFGDVEAGGITANIGSLMLSTTGVEAGTCQLFYYVPTSNDYSTGSVQLNYTTASVEVFQFNVFEVKNLDLSNLPTSLVGPTDADESNDDRATCGPLSLAAEKGDFMLVWGGVDDTAQVALDTENANGFTDGGYYPIGGGAGVLAIGAHQFHYRIAESDTTYSTPIYGNTANASLGTIGIVLKHA